jgi:hypothetical protein
MPRITIVLLLCLTGCASTPEQKAGWTALSEALGGLSAAASSHNRPYQAPPYDYSYAWDRVYVQYNNPVWQCRGIQTGQYAHESKCAYLAKVDNQWPN